MILSKYAGPLRGLSKQLLLWKLSQTDTTNSTTHIQSINVRAIDPHLHCIRKFLIYLQLRPFDLQPTAAV